LKRLQYRGRDSCADYSSLASPGRSSAVESWRASPAAGLRLAFVAAVDVCGVAVETPDTVGDALLIDRAPVTEIALG